MSNGTVKWFNATKCYRFIQPEYSAQDMFVHIAALQNSGISDLQDGQKVTYELETGKNGKTSAVNLTLV